MTRRHHEDRCQEDLGIWLSPNLSFSLHLEKSAHKAFAVLRMIRRTFSRITRTDFQILYGAYVSDGPQQMWAKWLSVERETRRLISSKLSSSPKDDTPPQPENEADKKILDVENDLQALQTEYKKLVTTHSQLEDKYKRALAESENMRKRFMRQVDEAKMFAVQSFCKDLLDVADVLTKATNSAPADQLVPGVNPHFTNLYEGLKLTEQQMLQVFERNHLVRIQPAEGDRFDPNFHEAVFQAPRQDGKEPNTIAVVTKVGYKLYDRPLRPAYVGVFGP
ncbi:molecular chaperone GrpE [Clonorchis sinensis]|uniref:GrpE protein homolog n=1 Tax=Clonorchis sinensis TaxID=79923 RepID=H2KQH8_CLOSI|nr:molecular chaperone GrpE [Clonorchis sinensis]